MKEATPPETPVWSTGVLVNLGGAEIKRDKHHNYMENWNTECYPTATAFPTALNPTEANTHIHMCTHQDYKIRKAPFTFKGSLKEREVTFWSRYPLVLLLLKSVLRQRSNNIRKATSHINFYYQYKKKIQFVLCNKMSSSIKVSKILALCFDAIIRALPESSTATAKPLKLVTFKRNSRKF